MEYDIIEIEKFIRRNGGSLEYPQQIRFVKPFDFYTNYPMILHGSKNTTDLLQLTLEAYRAIFKIQNKQLNKTVSVTIAWEMEEFECRLSILGKSSEVLRWLNQIQQIPTDHPSFKDWLKLQKEWIYKHYSYQQRDLLDLLQSDGMFLIKRTFIDPAMISFPDTSDSSYMELHVGNNNVLNGLLQEQKIFPAQLCLLEKVSCTKTGENYLTSGSSKYLDEGVQMVVERMDLLGFFWTDEPYQ